jgi:hypothetical protein
VGREDEVVYPKVIKAFEFFKSQPVDVIASVAAEEVRNPETSNLHRSQLKSSGVSKSDSLIIGKSVHSLFKDLYTNPYFKKDVCKIQNMAVKKVAELKRMSEEELKKAYKEFLISEKMLNKYNWCDIFSKSAYGVY